MNEFKKNIYKDLFPSGESPIYCAMHSCIYILTDIDPDENKFRC